MSEHRWTRREECAFFAQLAEAWPEGRRLYGHLAAWCEAHGRPRPSAMSGEQRRAMLDWLGFQANQERILAWEPEHAEREAALAEAAELQVDSMKEAIRAAAEQAGIAWGGRPPLEDGPRIDADTTVEQIRSFIASLRARRAA